MKLLNKSHLLALQWWARQDSASVSEYKEVYRKTKPAADLIAFGYLEDTGRTSQTTGDPEPDYRVSAIGQSILLAHF